MNALFENARRLVENLSIGSSQTRWALASQIVTSGANFATTLIIVRSLGLSEFGQFSMCFVLAMIARNFLNAMLLSPMSTIAPKLAATSQQNYRGFLVAQLAIFAVGASVLLLALAMPLGIALNAPWLPELAFALVVANLMANGADFIRRYHFVQNAPHWAFFVDLVRFTVQLALLCGAAVFWQSGFSANNALHLLAIGSAFGFLMGLINFGSIGWSKNLVSAIWPRHWQFVKWQSSGVLLETLQTNLPLFIGTALLGEATIGLIRAMQSLANILTLPHNALQQIAPSSAAQAFSRQGESGMVVLLKRITFSSVALLLLLSVPAILFSKQIIGDWFGIDFDFGFPVFISFCLLNLFLVLRMPLVVLFQTVEQPKILAISEVFGLVASLVTSILLVKFIGALGIPLAFVATASVIIIILWMALNQQPSNLRLRVETAHQSNGSKLRC